MTDVKDMTAEELVERIPQKDCECKLCMEVVARLRERDEARHYAENHAMFPYSADVIGIMKGLLTAMLESRKPQG